MSDKKIPNMSMKRFDKIVKQIEDNRSRQMELNIELAKLRSQEEDLFVEFDEPRNIVEYSEEHVEIRVGDNRTTTHRFKYQIGTHGVWTPERSGN